jgi:hypothetical protein
MDRDDKASGGASRRAFLFRTGGALAFTAAATRIPGAAAAAGTDPGAAGRAGTSARARFKSSVAADGSWQVTTSSPQWTFGGTVGAATSGVTTSTGQDALGSYHETVFEYSDGGARRAGIRSYDALPVVIFEDTYVEAASNAHAFPTLSTFPQLDYRLSHQGTFGIYQFNTFDNASDSPWLFFGGSGESFLLSAADWFTQAETTQGSDGSISAGVVSSVADVPAGFTRQTILVVGDGIGETYRTWGNALTTLGGKRRAASDTGVVLEKFGYWTDHFATYYYDYDQSLGYTGTLEAVVADWQAKQLPLAYMQLDSWWYPKGPTADWTLVGDGEYLYEADPNLFPDGLAAFQSKLGLPLMTHARWVTATSPYFSEYKMSGDVCIDPAFWQSIMSYLRQSGVVVYEQDWLSEGAQPVYNLTDPDAFFGNMAAYAQTNGLTLQYCMPLPRDYLQSTKYSNLLTIRVSNDGFNQAQWDDFLYGSQLAGSLGAWPWTDVFMSPQTNNLLLSTLSAGPVGVGDAIGQQSAANIFQTARPDGVIVKPDAPIVPTDATYLAEAASDEPAALPVMIASTYVQHTGLLYGYVFAYARQVPAPQQIYQAEDATLSGPVVASSNPGYTGTGYADYQNASGDYVQWTVQVATAGTHSLIFRYANGGSGDRPLAITVNGADAGTLPFSTTGNWTSWDDEELVLTLPAGTSTVRATATGESGGNIDYLGISPGRAPVVPTQTASFEPSALGITGTSYVFDYFAGQGTLVRSGAAYQQTVTSGTYWIVAPVGRSGIAFLGDAGKFVAHGRKRLTSVSDGGTVQVSISFASGEGAITLRGHAPRRPHATAQSGTVGTVGYDASTGLFSVPVTPDGSAAARVAISLN